MPILNISHCHQEDYGTRNCQSWVTGPSPKGTMKNYGMKLWHFLKGKNGPRGFSGVSVVKNPVANAGDMELTPDPGGPHMQQSS